MLRKIVPATTPAVSLERAKERLRFIEEDRDFEIERLIEAATNVIEKETGAVFQLSTWEQTFPDWWPCPSTRGYQLDCYPVRSIVSVKYIDPDRVEQTVDPNDYALTSYSLDFFTTWTSYRNFWAAADPLRIQFVAGYDSTEADTDPGEFTLPAEFETAVLLLVGTWLENTESVDDVEKFRVPDGFKLITSQMRIYR